MRKIAMAVDKTIEKLHAHRYQSGGSGEFGCLPLFCRICLFVNMTYAFVFVM